MELPASLFQIYVQPEMVKFNPIATWALEMKHAA
jgi:hypothetical protein